MKTRPSTPHSLRTLCTTLIPLAMVFGMAPAYGAQCADTFNYKMRKLHSSESVDLCQLTAGKAVLVVNTASHCGFTDQFKGLEALHKRFKSQKLVVLGVASNSFNQEDKQEAAAAKVCFVNFGVTFTMLAPVPVKGAQAHPFFAGLNQQSSAPTWNFNKYLVDASGHVVAKFGSTTSPTSNKLVKAISGVLAQ